MSNWLQMLADAVEADPRGKAGIAERLDVSRTAISLVLDNKYPAKTDRIEAKVIAILSRVDCPFMGESITRSQCTDFANRAAPTNSPREMRHWRTCQTCPCKG